MMMMMMKMLLTLSTDMQTMTIIQITAFQTGVTLLCAKRKGICWIVLIEIVRLG